MMSIPPALVLGWLISPNVGWLLISTTTSMYLIYEFMHFCCHVDENWFVRHAPFVNTIRRHHTAHHNQSIMMERNMNLTFPVMDWLFGTSDLDRGLIGHLFNGYDTRFVKTNMRKTSRTPRPERGAAVRGIHRAGRVTRPARCRCATRAKEPAMQAIEPNWISLLWFAAFATIGTVALLIVAGMFPLPARPGSGMSTLLVFGNAVLLAGLLTGTGLYGYAEFGGARWSSWRASSCCLRPGCSRHGHRRCAMAAPGLSS